MMLARIAQHRMWSMLSLWALATLVNTSFLLSVVVWRATTQQTTISTFTMVLISWVGVATYLAFADVCTRCTPFDLSLPVRSRDLWLAHVSALTIGGAVVVGLTLGVVAVHRAILTGASVEPGGPSLALLLGTGVVLAILLLEAPRPTLARIPATFGYVTWRGIVVVGTPLLLVLAAGAGSVGWLLLLALTLATAGWSYRSVPSAYAVAPLEPEATERPHAAFVVPQAGARPASRLLVALTVLHSVSAGAKELAAAPIMILSGLMLGGGLLGIGDGDVGELRFLYIPMVTYLLFAVIGPRMVSLHHLDALPISRRSMAAALILPYLGLLCAGYGAGVLVSSGTRSAIEYVNFEERTNGYRVTVPLRVYHVAWDGCPRSVESPQGEVHTPEPLAPFRWSRAAVYSPYSAPVGSSAAFVALQISRAVQEVYGVSIPSATIEQRYLTTTEAGRVVPRGGEGLTLRADHPELKAGVGPMFPALITLTVVPWLLLVALLLRAYRPGVREWIRQTVVWGSLGVLLLFWLATSMSTVFQVMEPWGLRALVEIAVFGLGSTTGGTATVWLLALLLLAGAYWIAQSRFLRMEIPTHPSRYTLLGSR